MAFVLDQDKLSNLALAVVQADHETIITMTCIEHALKEAYLCCCSSNGL
jgi:hypothetical protein